MTIFLISHENFRGLFYDDVIHTDDNNDRK